MAPLKSVIAMLLSGMASIFFFFVSSRQGQKMKSKLASTSRIFSFMLTSEISHPPHDAAQYMASFGFSDMIFLLKAATIRYHYDLLLMIPASLFRNLL